MKKQLEINVFEAVQERVKYVFDHFEKIIVSFSAGKDSTVMLHLMCDEARKRNRKIAVMLIDLEGQYKKTIDHAERMRLIIKWSKKKNVPSWRRVCKSLLRNDYWCKGLSFTQQKSHAYERYCEMMKQKREQSGIELF